ncbi:unnamed protein product [Closterium sp. NIES-54]
MEHFLPSARKMRKRFTFSVIIGEEIRHQVQRIFIAETNGLDEPTARHIFLQIARGLRWCHHFDVAHRDIKPENKLLTSSKLLKSVRIGDFGLAQEIRNGEELRNVVGSYPEVLACEGNDLKADIWSLGVVLYMMVCADWPAFPNDRRELRPIDFAVRPWPSVSSDLRDLVRRMMEVDPTKRLSIDEVLLHPWIVSARGSTKAKRHHRQKRHHQQDLLQMNQQQQQQRQRQQQHRQQLRQYQLQCQQQHPRHQQHHRQ